MTFEEEQLEFYTGEELCYFIQQSRTHPDDRFKRIRLLSFNLVAKPFDKEGLMLDEVAAHKLAGQLGIRVPAIRRVIPSMPGAAGFWLIMDRVHGKSLENEWVNLGWWQTLKLGWELRHFVRVMRGEVSMKAGMLVSGFARSIFYEDIYGPKRHASPETFSGYMSWWLIDLPAQVRKPFPDLVPIISDRRPHVFTHQDITPRNMVIDDKNHLWLIDWGMAGYFPVYMEYIGMGVRQYAWSYGVSWRERWANYRWKLLRWIACGSYKKQEGVVDIICERSTRFPTWGGPNSEK
jgi:hypothetical protein